MAGGTFDKQVGKDRPGTYINFQSGKHDTVGGSDRGIVIIPLKNHNYGPRGEFITLTAAAPDAAYAKLGYSIYDSDDNRQMLLIREAFKKAATVIVYRVNGGTEAKVTAAPVTAKAKYPGTRGNQFSFTVSENPVEGFDVQVNLAGSKVAEYTGLKTVEELAAQDCKYITFSGTGALVKNAGANLTGGTDVTMQNADVTALLDASEGVKFNCMCFPFTEAALQAAAKTKIKYIRENIGKGVQIAMPNTASGDYEGVINVTNGVTVDGVDLTAEEACAWVAAATADAAAEYAAHHSLPVVVKADGLALGKGVIIAKTHEEAVAAIKNGEFFFSVSEESKVVVEYDINSLVSFKDGKDKSYRKNRVIRVFDTFGEALQLNFPPNKYDNDPDGWDIMEGIGRSLLKKFRDAGAIKNVDLDNDFLVDRELSEGDETYFNVGLEPVDSSEKIYFTVTTR